ncbi:hypothetical protein CYMTET_13799 [Cymbomonas tetramitiformis]|uniref:SAM domain-containing protein n=1 Tax=Cymbomonas tetramitiformis TaxID=36881 RepID=A0AAE0LB22_9CHLO|nr:hypothetical protein CYMTET_13799 [Cymbomonas tetramitiformis]
MVMILLTLLVMAEAGIVCLVDTYHVELDITRHGYGLLIVIYPELWREAYRKMKARHSGEKKVAPCVEGEVHLGVDAANIPTLSGVPRASWRRDAESSNSLYKLLVTLNLQQYFEALNEEDLDDMKILVNITEAQLKLHVGMTLGAANDLLRAVRQVTKVDNVFPLGDVIDRACMIVFPIAWMASIQGTLGQHVKLSDVVFGLIP